MVVVFVVVVGGSVALLVRYANQIVKSQLESRLGKSFSIERIDLKWGHVEVVGVTLKNPAGKEVIKVGNLSVAADFMGLLRKQYVISDVTVKDAYVFVEIDNKGNVVSPVLPPEIRPAQAAAANKEAPGQPAPPITIKKIEVVNASVDYLDRKTPVKPVLTKLRNIDLTVDDVAIPFADTFSNYVLSAAIPGNKATGAIRSKGKIKIKTNDVDLTATLRDLDITALKPYFQKESPVDITRGFLNLDLTVKVASKRLHAPGTATLKELEFQSGSGMGARFMGVPLSLLVEFLKNSNDVIPVKFTLDGDLNNPRFDIKENVMQRISMAMTDKLGLPIKGIPEAVTSLGSKVPRELGSTLKELGGGLQNLFKK
jgi:hypothetical protein